MKFIRTEGNGIINVDKLNGMFFISFDEKNLSIYLESPGDIIEVLGSGEKWWAPFRVRLNIVDDFFSFLKDPTQTVFDVKKWANRYEKLWGADDKEAYEKRSKKECNGKNEN